MRFRRLRSKTWDLGAFKALFLLFFWVHLPTGLVRWFMFSGSYVYEAVFSHISFSFSFLVLG